MRAKLAAILFVIILAFITVYTTDVFNKLFIESNSKFTESASAAFLGAFLAFIFVRVADFFKSYSDRVAKSHSALVKLQHSLNNLLTSLDDNIYVIEIFEKIYNTYKVKSPEHTFIWANKLHPVELHNDIIIDLLNIDLINELFSLNIHLRKLNNSMDTTNDAYQESKNALIAKNITPQNYLDNVANLYSNLLTIKKFLKDAMNETTIVFAAIRILAKQKPLISYIFPLVSGPSLDKSFNVKRDKERNALLEEIKTTKQKSSDRINETLNK